MKHPMMMAALPAALALAAALAGCGRDSDVKVQRVTAALPTPTPTPAPTAAPTPTPTPAPPPPLVAFIPGGRPVRVFGYQGTTGFSSPDEVRLYARDSSGTTVLMDSRGTVQIDAVGTSPLPLKLSPNGLYLYAKLPTVPKLPVGARFQLYDRDGKWNSTGAFIDKMIPMPDDLDESLMPEHDLAKRRFSAEFATTSAAVQAAVQAKDFPRAAKLAEEMASGAEQVMQAHPAAFNPRMVAAGKQLRDVATSMSLAAQGDGSRVGPIFKDFRETGREFLRFKPKDNK